MGLKIDFAFKQLFGKAGNETILLVFLYAALQLPEEERIRSVEILNPEIEREHIEDKASVLDIHAKTEQGEHVNIEIQLANDLSPVRGSGAVSADKRVGNSFHGDAETDGPMGATNRQSARE